MDEKSFSVFAWNSFNALDFNLVNENHSDFDFGRRCGITELSTRVGGELVHLLTKNKITQVLKYIPHINSPDISAASLRSAKHLRTKLEQEARRFVFQSGTEHEFSAYIDSAVQHLIKTNQDDTSFKLPEDHISVKLSLFPEPVWGTPDALYERIPIELKTVPSIQKYLKSQARRTRGINQLALYQFAYESSNGFIVIVSRETGDILCLEANESNMDAAYATWRSWMFPFTLTSETVLERFNESEKKLKLSDSLGDVISSRFMNNPLDEEQRQSIYDLVELLKSIPLDSCDELTDEALLSLQNAHDRWLKSRMVYHGICR